MSDVTTATMVPGNESGQRIEIDGAVRRVGGADVYVNRVAEDFFDAFDAPI